METTEVIDTMINKIEAGDNVGAQDDFAALISTKLQTAIEVKKQEIAQSIYQNQEITDDETEETDPEVA
jgi:hypothetical protein